MELIADSVIVSTWGASAWDVRSRYYIYSIRCKANGKNYIGETCFPKERFRSHLYKLRKGKHHSEALQADFDKFGEDGFEIRILDTVDKYLPTALSAEKSWIKKTEAFDLSKGYNDDRSSKVLRGEHPCPWTRHNVRKRKAI